MHNALVTVVDLLIEGGLSEYEAKLLVGKLLAEEAEDFLMAMDEMDALEMKKVPMA